MYSIHLLVMNGYMYRLSTVDMGLINAQRPLAFQQWVSRIIYSCCQVETLQQRCAQSINSEYDNYRVNKPNLSNSQQGKAHSNFNLNIASVMVLL